MQHKVAADSVALKTDTGLSAVTKILRLNVSSLNTVNTWLKLQQQRNPRTAEQ